MPNDFDTSQYPLGSTHPYVLYNNAGNEDLFVNDIVNETWVDRPPFNRVRKTIYGMEQDFLRALEKMGYETTYLTYVDGSPLQVDRPTQLISRGGSIYAVKLPANFPLTLTGTWATDQNLLVDVGDQSLRTALAAPGGATLIEHNGTTVEASLDALEAESVGVVSRAVRAITNIAELNTLLGRFAGDTVYYVGIANTSNPPFNVGFDNFRWITGTAYAADGQMIFGTTGAGRWVRQAITGQQALPAALAAWLPATAKVYATGSLGKGYTTLNVKELWKTWEVSGVVNYYVDTVGGLDSNPGLAPNAPLKTIGAAIAKGDVGVIQVKPGTYYESLGNVIGVSVNRDIQIRTFTGGKDVTIRNTFDPAAITWTVETGLTYKATLSSTVFRVLDLTMKDSQGDYKDLAKQTSVGNVTANPGSWFYDSGTGILYIRRYTNVAPGADILVPKASTNGQINANRALLLENLLFEGGGGLRAITDGTSPTRLYLTGCTVKYAANNGVEILGGYCFSQDTVVARSGLDSFNYHDSGSVIGRAIEIDCVSYAPGDLAQRGWAAVGDTQNASSMHDAGSILRINGRYSTSYGPIIPDTSSAVSYNIGVEAFDSLGLTTQNVTWYSNGQMTLIDCSSRGSNTDARAESGGVIYIRNFMSRGLYSGNVQRI